VGRAWRRRRTRAATQVTDRARARIRGVLRSAILTISAVAALGSSGAGATVPASTGCPAHPLIELPVNPWPATHSTLAPPGASTIRLCRYGPFPSRGQRALAGSAEVRSASVIKSLTAALDGLPAADRLAFCPMDNGSEIDMSLSYPGRDRHGDFIRVELTGCENATNGPVTRTAARTAAGQRLLATLRSLAS
jgi:hypothetical protein